MDVILEMIPLTRKQLRAKRVSASTVFSMVPNPFLLCQIFGLRNGPPPTIRTRKLPENLRLKPVWLKGRVLRKNALGERVRYATIRELKKIEFPKDSEGCRFFRSRIENDPEDAAIVFLWRATRN